jgi:hypothetical protein
MHMIHDDMLNGGKLQAGLDWLGLKLDVMTLRQFMREIDKDKYDFMTWENSNSGMKWKVKVTLYLTIEYLFLHHHQKTTVQFLLASRLRERGQSNSTKFGPANVV